LAYRLGVDVGGTFTDLFLVDDADHRQWRVKTPSTPADPSQGVLTGVRRICEEAGIAPGDLGNVVHARRWPPTPCSSPRAPASG
jgi:N-methylhydantoinase A